MSTAAPLLLSPAERSALPTWAHGRSFPLRLVPRAHIVQMTAEGTLSQAIARELHVSRPTVQLWRERFLALRLAGLEKDAPRPGRIPSIPEKKVRAIVEAPLQGKPPNATHWSTRSMAKAQGLSHAPIRRIWKHHTRNPHLSQTFKISRANHLGETRSAELDRHSIVDHYATHTPPRVKSWLRRHPRCHLHCIPTSSSWVNMVARWFREITDKRMRRGRFRHGPELITALETFLENHNQTPRIFTWTASVESLLANVSNCKDALDSLH